MNIYQEQRIRSFFASRPVLIVLFLLLVGMGVVSFQSLLAGRAVEEERLEVEREARNLEAKKDKLTSELEDLRSGKGIEREAREKLNFRKPGEEVVIILDNNGAAENGQAETSKSLAESIKEFLIHLIPNF
mgnify:CR=1 FL=1